MCHSWTSPFEYTLRLPKGSEAALVRNNDDGKEKDTSR